MKYFFITFVLFLVPMQIFAAMVFLDTIELATVERVPFSYEEAGNIKGFSIELWNMVAAELDLETDYTMYSTFSDMLASVATGTHDIAVANISITAEREEYLDFSHPIYDSGLQFIGKKNHLIIHRWKDSVAKWFLLLLPILLISLFYISAKGKKYSLGRIILFIMLLFSIGVLHIQAKVGKLGHIITYKDITKEHIGTSKGTTMSAFLDQKNIAYTAYDDFHDALEALDAGMIEVVLGDAAVVTYAVQHTHTSTLELVGRVFNPDNLAFAFTEDSPWVEEVNTWLLEFKEDGRYDALYDSYFK